MLTFLCIVTAELVLLFRLALPDILAFAEARHHEVYGLPHGDVPALPTIDSPNFHDTSNITEAQRYHG